MLPLPPLALESILKAFHLGGGVPSTQSKRVMGKKTGREEEPQRTSVRKKKKKVKRSGEGKKTAKV